MSNHAEKNCVRGITHNYYIPIGLSLKFHAEGFKMLSLILVFALEQKQKLKVRKKSPKTRKMECQRIYMKMDLQNKIPKINILQVMHEKKIGWRAWFQIATQYTSDYQVACLCDDRANRNYLFPGRKKWNFNTMKKNIPKPYKIV